MAQQSTPRRSGAHRIPDEIASREWWRLVGLRLRLALAMALAAMVAAWLAPTTGAAAQQVDLPDEYTVKAVYLYSFARYIEWPKTAFADDSAPFVIGIIGDAPFDDALIEIAAKKKIQNRRVAVQRFASTDEFQEPCHILFVSRSLTGDEQTALLKKTQKRSVLVVGETPGFAKRGAAINFFIDEERVRFEINTSSARRAKLRINAKLLTVGKRVDR